MAELRRVEKAIRSVLESRGYDADMLDPVRKLAKRMGIHLEDDTIARSVIDGVGCSFHYDEDDDEVYYQVSFWVDDKFSMTKEEIEESIQEEGLPFDTVVCDFEGKGGWCDRMMIGGGVTRDKVDQALIEAIVDAAESDGGVMGKIKRQARIL